MNEPRTELAEVFAVLTLAELKAVLDRIEAKGRGLGRAANAGGRARVDDENDCPTIAN